MAMLTKLTAAGIVVGAAGLGFLSGQRFAPAREPAQIVLPAVPGAATLPARTAPRTSQSNTTMQEPTPVVVSSLRDILQIKSDFAQTTALYMLASRRDRKGVEVLLVEAGMVASDSDRNAATGILYSRLAELDPEAAVERILQSDDYELRYLQNVFHPWARDNLQQALARAAALKDERSRTLALRSILLSRPDLPQAQREAIATKYRIGVVAGNLGPRPDLSTPASSERSWRDALAMMDSQQRGARLNQIAYLWARQSPEAALQAIEQLDDVEQRSGLLYQSLRAWSEKSPQAAYEWAQARRPSPERVQLMSLALQTLARQQPQVAVELAEKLPRAEQRSLVPQLLQQWATEDLPAATSWLGSVKDPAMRTSALYSIANAYSLRSPDEALRWAASLPPSDSQNVMSTIIGRVAMKDPLRASSMINGFPEGNSRDSATYSVASAWSRRDPAAALAWAVRVPSGPVRNSAVTAIFGSWASYDPQAAIQQAVQLTDSTLRDSAAAAMLGNQDIEPSQAEQLYSRIENPQLRRSAAAQLYYRLRNSDPALAERYRRDGGIPELPPTQRQ